MDNFNRTVRRAKFWGWCSSPRYEKCCWCNRKAEYDFNLLLGIMGSRTLCKKHNLQLIRKIDKMDEEVK